MLTRAWAPPDIGLVSFAEVCETLATIRERSAAPIIVDADTGYGNALNVQRTVMRLERAEAYLDAGADVLFIEAVRNVSRMRLLTERFAARVPLLANMVEGGKTPLKNARELQEIGYRLAIFPGGTVRALAHALDAYFTELKSSGSNQGNATRMFDFDSLNALLGTRAILERSRRYEG